ncbi:HEAT repeat domain-containing protein [Novipirellula artificiosorum]|uniref:HEAT repeat protein n=1 Tax=Novipirellula artificiosorum TaxID=2528016 RepID=A0A5C6DD47_9BACT|nr:HEAT repeat domain-containing protein [Novipirellula artificiosorum]TWU33697.1 hypothetical protein Poly41_46930 [Novipirellula artificiosorum]
MFRMRLALICFAMLATSLSIAPMPLHADEAEQPLIDILASDAPKAEKAITCKKLAVWGSGAAVPELSKLLADPELTSWARIALEAITDTSADAALIDALETTEGRTLVGVINSIGVRKSPDAVDGLTQQLANDDEGVATSAAVALGKIGGEQVVTTLRKTIEDENTAALRSAAAEGLILCAEAAVADGDAENAIELYDAIRQADLPKPRIVEATRGAILARHADGLELLIEQLQSDDRVMLGIGLTTARELSGEGVTAGLVEALDQVDAYRKELLILAMADRGDASVLPAMTQVAAEGEANVRVAAIRALQSIGDVTCVNGLLQSATDEDSEVATAAKTALAKLAGRDVDDEIVVRLDQADGAARRVLIDLVGMRRIAAVPALLKAVDASDAATREAALTALGQVAELDDLSVLIDRVNHPKNASDAEPAQSALRAACVRMGDREACAAKLGEAMNDASLDTKGSLLEVLAAMGGTKALDLVGNAANSDNAQLQDIATRLLGEWMTIDAGPVLIELAKQPNHPYRIRALRGHLRLVRQFLMEDSQRVAMAREAFEAADRDAEKELVLEAVQRYPNLEMLQLAVQIGETPSLKDKAANTAMMVARKLGGSDEVVSLLKQLGKEPMKVQIVEAIYGAGDQQKDVTKILQKAAGDFTVIALPSESYNKAFGGDPAPGLKKLLQVQYKINDKEGDAVFQENSAIVLPLPE